MLIIALLVFLAVIFVGMILFFRQIMSKNVVSATEHLEEMSREYMRKEDELSSQRKELEQKAKETVSGAEEEAQRLKDRILSAAETEKEKLLKQAHAQSDEIIAQADKSRQALLGEIEERIKKESLERASLLLEQALPEDFRQQVHLRWTEELIKSGFTDIENLELPAGEKQVKLISAFPLKEEERRTIFKRLKNAISDSLPAEEVDASLIAGIIICIGSTVLDGSLKNKIREMARSIDE